MRPGGNVRDVPTGGTTLLTRRAPVGLSVVITPWNYPLAMATRKIAPALAAGCPVVIKPPALTPLTTYYAVTLAHRPLSVFDDADLERAVNGAYAAKLRNGGQSCIGANRIYVQDGRGSARTASLNADDWVVLTTWIRSSGTPARDRGRLRGGTDREDVRRRHRPAA